MKKTVPSIEDFLLIRLTEGVEIPPSTLAFPLSEELEDIEPVPPTSQDAV